MKMRHRCPRPAQARRGLTLIEVMVAIMLLSFALLGMAGFSITVGRQYRSSGQQQTAALLVQSRLDSLASINCALLAPSGTQTGTAMTMGIREKWVIEDGNDIKSISDTVRIPGRNNPLVYRSIIPCRD